MAEQYQNPMSNIGYTDQDFQTAYPQLLNLAKELSDKWDPSQSNESDPGVVLIKEQAVLDDKLHYSVDKNILETFPESVTQLQNARQIFEQSGYTMQWYVGATGQIYFRWIDMETEADTLDIPKFSMVCDDESNIVYTILRDVVVDKDGTITEPVDVIQGTIHDYNVNGQTKITAQNLDEDYRLYFSDYNVAENGIFIKNDETSDWDEWKPVDNLYTQPYGSKIFKFGILQDNSTCFIEFPEYIADIIGSGINIKYILTSGIDGNIKANTLVKFFDGASALPRKQNDDGDPILLTTDNISIVQSSSILTGYDPEGINSAYRNYKKTIGVFDTLVSLRDYNDYLNSEGVEADLLSNGFATDRTNDIQDSYFVVTKRNDVYVKKLVVEQENYVTKDTSDNYVTIQRDSIQPFELKLYLLQYAGNFEYLTTIADLTQNFEQSFSFLNNIVGDNDSPYNENQYWDYVAVAGDENYILQDPALLDGAKCISHNFINPEADKILFLKNKYPLTMTVVPTQTLSVEQRELMERNITKAICTTLNAKNIAFGEQVDYDVVYDAIRNCDNRIRNLYLDDITYITSAVYFDSTATEAHPNGEVKEIEISDETDYVEGTFTLSGSSATNVVCTSKAGWKQEDQLVGTLLMGASVVTNFVGTVTGDGTKTSFDITLPSDYSVFGKDGVTVSSGTVESYSQSGTTLTIVFETAPANESVVSVTAKCTDYTVFGKIIRKTEDGNWELYSNKRDDFRNEIYAKCVLAGNTQLLVPADTFKTSLSQQMQGDAPTQDITKLEPNFDLCLGFSDTVDSIDYTIKENEQIYLTAPNMLTVGETYGARYLCHLNSTVPMGTDHLLASGETEPKEWVILIYKTDDKAANYTYTFYTYPTIFSADITMANTDGNDSVNVSINQPTGATGTVDTNLAKNVKNYFTASQAFYTKKENSVYLIGQTGDPTETKLYCYWFLNSKQGDEYVLSLNSNNDYTLKSGEQFIYTNSKFNTAIILGTGTSIHWEDSRWADPTSSSYQLPSVTAISIENFLFNGLNAIPKEDYFPVDNGKTSNLTVTENEVIALGSQDKIYFKTESEIVRNASVVKSSGVIQQEYVVDVGNISLEAIEVENQDHGLDGNYGVKVRLANDSGYLTLDGTKPASGDYDGCGYSYANGKVTVYIADGELTNNDEKKNLTITIQNKVSSGNTEYLLTKVPININDGSVGSINLASLSYQFFGDNATNELPINDGVRTWKIQTAYLLDMSQEKEQELSNDNATVTVSQDGDVTVSIASSSKDYASIDFIQYPYKDTSVPPVDKIGTIYPSTVGATLNLLSDIPVSTQGEEVVNTVQQTLQGKKNLSLYQFTNSVAAIGSVEVDANEDGTYTIEGESSAVSLTITASLPDGKYLIPYSITQKNPITDSNYVSVSAEYDSVSLDPIEQGTTYRNFVVENPNESGADFEFTATPHGTPGKWSVTIGNIYCYKETIDNFDDIVTKVAYYDTKRDFDFTYQVEEDRYIENPLKADSFMNPEHPYNKFTICQANFETSRYNILTNRGNR